MRAKVIISIVAVVVLAGAFLLFKPAAKPTPPQTKTFTLVVKNRKLVTGPTTLTVTQGDSVVIKITADEDEELHLHGYDKMVDLTKGVPAELHLRADVSGSFPYELEHSKTDIGSLQVQPKP